MKKIHIIFEINSPRTNKNLFYFFDKNQLNFIENKSNI